LGQAGDYEEIFKRLAAKGYKCQFLGYTESELECKVILLLGEDGEVCAELTSGAVGYMVTDKTPCYGASGGQVGDLGELSSKTCQGKVLETMKPCPTLLVHKVQINEGSLRTEENILLRYDQNLRLAAARNHSCTHLLHAALRAVLGTHVHQMGSLVDATHLRFDFSHVSALTQEQIEQVELWVNQRILANLPITTQEMSLDEAMQTGAMALFEEKYGEKVRVVTMGNASQELCGGTHLTATGEAGLFLILSESAVAAGTRRIEAVTGFTAYQKVKALQGEMRDVASAVKAVPGQLVEKVTGLQQEVKKLRKDAEKGVAQNVSAKSLLEKLEHVGDISLLCVQLEDLPIKVLRNIMDETRSLLPKQAVICLADRIAEKINLLLYVSKDLHQRFTAPKLIADIAVEIGGSGGGRPDLAQAGGNNAKGLKVAFVRLKQLLSC
ncbi:MAG: alanine--tRNA ligase, partial [Desulfovibrio sp.]|nr:alanine--tRNA ligase [Desulfovibrio sp.]